MNLPFIDQSAAAIPITVVNQTDFVQWLPQQSKEVQSWLDHHGFKAEPGTFVVIRDGAGAVISVVAAADASFWFYAKLAAVLPKANYFIVTDLDQKQANYACLAWALASYQFDRYKKAKMARETWLVWPKNANREWVAVAVAAICQGRDLINTPAADLTPLELAKVVESLGKECKAHVKVVKGNALQQDYPAVYTVGKAAAAEPCLIDLTWKHPQAIRSLTLVGKGVTFDTGGLDLKPASGMLSMKKDMGGAAYVIALARLIMTLNYPLNLRVLIPAAENAVNGNAMRPLDIITMKNRTTVEIGNTDAEGRLILADALSEAIVDRPDLIIDCATLTGAARVALGPDLPAIFSNNDALAKDLIALSGEVGDPLWQLPLFEGYRSHLKSPHADMNNVAKHSLGGAIIAALFLEHFVESTPWIHMDTMAWNATSQPGRPEGGDLIGWLSLAEFVARWAA